MADRPIIFSAPMVQALLAGRKTQTRRLLALRGHRNFSQFGPSDTAGYDWHFRDAGARWHDHNDASLKALLPWQVGDLLWVRENVRAEERASDHVDGVRYASDDTWDPIDNTQEAADGWLELFYYRGRGAGLVGHPVPSIHMPRWVSRLTLLVTEVRVQRLHDLSLPDALAEGAPIDPYYRDTSADGSGPPMVAIGVASWQTPRAWYHGLWDSLQGPDAWDANPWVVALTFSVKRGNIDA